jgi:hypothetical protein
MGLHTSYLGHIAIEPPLSPEETEFVRSFGRTRHWDSGETGVRLAAHPSDNDEYDDIDAYNRPAPGMPGLWCPWTVCKDGCCLNWDGIEKPYDADRWLEYLIDTFLAAGGSVAGTDVATKHGLTCDHLLDGVVVGERHETGELFALEVVNCVVVRRTLVPKRPGVDEWGYGSPESERRDRRRRLAERRKRFEAALAEDRLAETG